MKLYTFPPAPNPRRLSIFLEEKGIDLETQVVDLMAGEQFSQEYRAINPSGTVPALFLDKGVLLTEVVGIYIYLESTFPETPLLGTDNLSRAEILSWDHRCFVEGFQAVAEVLRNGNKAFSGRALPGPVAYEQIPELAVRGHQRIQAFYQVLDKHLGGRQYMVGDSFTVADIAAWVFVEFSGWVKERVPEACTALTSWCERTKARPSVQLKS